MGNFQYLSSIFLAASMLSFGSHRATAYVSGSGDISVEDYPDIGPEAPYNPPFCGMPWSELDLDLITAVEGLDASDCGACLQVCGDYGCEYVLAVDQGGDGLDLSTGCSMYVIGNDDGRGYATWEEVDESYCYGIWTADT
jgi:hypothetical protein